MLNPNVYNIAKQPRLITRMKGNPFFLSVRHTTFAICKHTHIRDQPIPVAIRRSRYQILLKKIDV